MMKMYRKVSQQDSDGEIRMITAIKFNCNEYNPLVKKVIEKNGDIRFRHNGECMIVFDDRYVTLRPSDYWVFDEGNSSVMSNSAFGWFTTDNHFVAGCIEHEWVQQKPIKYEEVDVIKWTGENEKEIVNFVS